jgi:hypothetical protein
MIMPQALRRATAAALACALPLLQPAAAEPSREELVRTAFVYNIAKFVDWPAESFPAGDLPLAFCVAGAGALAAADASLADKTIRDRPLRIVAAATRPAEHCHVAYVAGTAAVSPDAFAGWGTLVICDPEVAGRPGCIVRLGISDNRLRFAIDRGAAGRANLRISSKLLALATDVVNP